MAWTLLAIPGAGTIATIAGWATKVVNNFRHLKGIDGVVTTQSGLIIDNSLGTEYVKLPLLSTAEAAAALVAEGQVAHDEATTHRIKLHDGTAVRSLVSTVDVDDTPVNGADTDPISSNWAFDHLALLTTAGDIPYATGAGVWVKRGIGTAYQVLRTNAGATAPEWASSTQPVIVRKTADETVNNSSALQDDDELFFPMAANEIYHVKLLLLINSNATADFKLTPTIPALAAQYATGAVYRANDTFGSFFSDIAGSGAATSSGIVEFIVINGANAGNFQVQWAQNTANASDTKLLTNSFIVAQKLA